MSGGDMEAIVTPYLDIEGVTAAALVSNDGLLVAAAGDRVDLEAAAAIAATTLASADGLAGELAGVRPRLVSLDLDGLGLVLAPLTGELFLLLLGTSAILGLSGHGLPV